MDACLATQCPTVPVASRLKLSLRCLRTPADDILLTFAICAYKTHIYVYFENAYLCIFGFAYLCTGIFCAYLCIWYNICALHMLIMHIFIAHLLFAYLCIFLHILYCILLNTLIFKYAYYGILPSCIFKHITHILAYNMHIYAYFGLIMHIYCMFLTCIFLACLVLHISCIFLHILICM